MEENERNLAVDEKRVEDIIEEINIAILNDKDYIEIDDGRSVISINISKNSEKEDEHDIEFGGKKIATVKKGEKVPSDILKREIQRYQSSFSFDKVNNGLGRNATEKERDNPESLKLEIELNQAIKEGRATKLREGREITAAGEDVSLMLKRMTGERGHEIYRVRDKNDSHKFKYIAKDNSGEYFEPRGSRASEGTNPRQMCWIQNTNGTFERKPVDDMKVFGKYVIATDINVTTDSTRTLVGQRTPKGEYILMPALDHRVANTSSNINIKDNLSRGNSIWEIEDVIEAANLGEKIREIKKDGKLSADEVEFINKLKKEGLKNEKIIKILDIAEVADELREQGLNDASIKAILDTVDSTAEQIDELKKENFSDKEISQVMKLVHEDRVKFKDAKRKVSEDRRDIRDEKSQNKREEGGRGPWDGSPNRRNRW